MPTLNDHEARIAALEASQFDYRAVLAAVNALGANQRDQSLVVAQLTTDVGQLKTHVDQLKAQMADGFQLAEARFRAVDEQLAEIKDHLIIAGRDR